MLLSGKTDRHELEQSGDPVLGNKRAAAGIANKQGIDTQASNSASGGSGTTGCTSCGCSGSPELPEKAYKPNSGIVESYTHTKKVGNYLIGRDLGAGSFATVKEALHVGTGERVAIKIIDKESAKADAYVARNMRREGRILQLVRHSNIVQLLEVMETENCYYLVMELCHGGDFMTHLVKRRRLTEAETRRFMRQMVQAVGYLHSMGILHRDLKIENLMLTQDHNLKIIDFGLSNMVHALHGENGNIITQLFRTQCGSPAYAAPEVLAKKSYGPAVDIWSLGVNMFAMLTGNLPFTVKPYNIKALYQKMVNQELNPLPKTLSTSCRDLMMRLLNPEPETRIKLKDVMNHPWLNENVSRLSTSPFPNHLTREDLRQDVVHQVVHQLLVPEAEVVRKVLDNLPSPCLSAYLLLLAKTERFSRQNPVAKTRPRPCPEGEDSPTQPVSRVTGGASSMATVNKVERAGNEERSGSDETQTSTVGSVTTSKESPKLLQALGLPRREKTFAGCVPLSSDLVEHSELVSVGRDGPSINRASGCLTARHGSFPVNFATGGQTNRYHRTLPGLPEQNNGPQTERWADLTQQQSVRGSETSRATPSAELRRVATDSGRISIQGLVTQRYASTLGTTDVSRQAIPGRSYQTAAGTAASTKRPTQPYRHELISPNLKATSSEASGITPRRFSVAAKKSPELDRR